MRRERTQAPKARRRRDDDLTELGGLEVFPPLSGRSRRLAGELAELLAEIDRALLENAKEVWKMQTLKRLALLVTPAALFLAVFAGGRWP